MTNTFRNKLRFDIAMLEVTFMNLNHDPRFNAFADFYSSNKDLEFLQWFLFQCSAIRQYLGLPRRINGQGLVEYSLILALVAMVVVATVITVGQRTSSFYDKLGCRMPAGEQMNTNC